MMARLHLYRTHNYLMVAEKKFHAQINGVGDIFWCTKYIYWIILITLLLNAVFPCSNVDTLWHAVS